MKKLIKYSSLALIIIASGYNAAIAIPVNITGNVIASPCVVSNSGGQTVLLGNLEATSLATAGSVSPLVPFTLNLTSCPAGTSSVVASFAGTADPDANTRYRNNGTATNLAVEIWQGTTAVNSKGPGTSITQPVATNRSVSFPLSARVYSKGNSAPGTITATAQVTFTYQ